MMLTNFEMFCESIKNPILLKSEIKKLVWDIKKITPTIKKSNMTFHDYSKMYWELEIRWLDFNVKGKIEKLLKSTQHKLLNNGLVMGYKISQHAVLKLVGDDLEMENTGEIELWINLFFKDLYTRRFSPPRYVYHVSKTKNRESIKRNGLIPKEFTEGNWTFESFRLYYPPTVFVALESHGHYEGLLGDDIWRIDTTGLKNIWWEDLNFYRHNDPEKRKPDYLMTFEPIPPEHLKLVKR